MKTIQVSEFAHKQATIEKVKRGGNLPDAIDRIVANHLNAVIKEDEAILFDMIHRNQSGEKK